MTTRDPARAEALAVYINKLNEDRDTLERSVQLAATKQAKELYDVENDSALVLAAPGWHLGVIGIVAGRIAEKYNLPTVIISMDQMGLKPSTGSARSACGVNLHEALEACREHLISCGGHAAAAGLRIDESNLAAFRLAFCEIVAQQCSGKPRQSELNIDAQAVLNQIDLSTVMQLEKMAPFGSIILAQFWLLPM